MKNLRYLFLLVFVFLLLGCMSESDKKELGDVERQQQIYTKNQPPPFFTWSLERHLMSELYDKRNKAIITYSYVQNQYSGKLMYECPSIGFPIPADTQLTNPLRPSGTGGSGVIAVEQAEPNGLYTSKNTRGTYVMEVNADGTVSPAYFEQDVSAFTRPMKEVDGKLVPKEGFSPSLSIDPKVKINHPAYQTEGK
jgi:hypothetical protein